MWEKEKMLVTSIFSFSRNVFKSHVSKARQNVSLCGNGLNVGLFGKRLILPVNILSHKPDFFKTLKKEPFENIVGKVTSIFSVSHCFLPFPKQISIFQPLLSSAQAFSFHLSNILSFGKELKFNFLSFLKKLTLYHAIPTFNDPKIDAFCKHCGKRKNASNQHFLLFPLCFRHFLKQV